MPDERDTFAVMLSQLQMTIGWQYRASGFVESGAVFFAPVVERKTEGEAENHAVTCRASGSRAFTPGLNPRNLM